MPVPASLASLSTTAGSNPPSGGENPFPDLDDHIRAGYAFDAQNRDAIAAKLNASAVSAFMLTVLNDADAATARATLGAVGLTGTETISGAKTFSSPVAVGSATLSGHAYTKGQFDGSFASSAENAAGTVEGKPVDPLGVREAFNATGGAPVYACRAWIKFSGLTGALISAGNATVTKNGVGNYTVAFTAPMPDENYTVICMASRADGAAAVTQINHGLYTANQVAVLVVGQAGGTTAPYDADIVCLSVFR